MKSNKKLNLALFLVLLFLVACGGAEQGNGSKINDLSPDANKFINKEKGYLVQLDCVDDLNLVFNDSTGDLSCSPLLVEGEFISNVSLVEEDSQSFCEKGVNYDLSEDLTSLIVSDGCFGVFDVTVESIQSYTELFSDVDLDSLEFSEDLGLTFADLSEQEGGVIDYEWENSIFASEYCMDEFSPFRGFSFEIPTETTLMKLSNLKGFMNSNKISVVNLMILDQENQVTVNKSFDVVNSSDVVINNLENSAYLVIYFEDDTNCSESPVKNFKAHFYQG